MVDRIPMTQEGYERLQEELSLRLSNQKDIIEQIKEARAHGDLSENAEYDAAKEAQALNEGRIRELERILSLAQVINNDHSSSQTASFGAWVTLLEEDSDKKVVYRLVGTSEADAKKGTISIESATAKAILGKKIGDWIYVVTPRGEKAYEIRAISYKHPTVS